MKISLCLSLLICLALAGGVAEAPVYAQQKKLQGVHGKKSVMPKNCRSCHMGMTMALTGEEGVCLNCHGTSGSRNDMVSKKYLRLDGRIDLKDIEVELRKPYNHPVLTKSGVHQGLETLPEVIVNAARHAECVDCHEPHLVEKERPFRGLKGRKVGNFVADIVNEYELCYKCHSESVNMPGTSTNKHAEFKTTNMSFHPVEGEGRSTFVISLKEPYVARKEKPADVSMITCSDCHGSDDPDGPRGPHGSRYAGLLKYNYEMGDEVSESARAYELCYTCHDRASILGNQSFPYHALHIQGVGPGSNGTSCFTCHDAHGSISTPHLIRFNEAVVMPNANDKLEYDPQGYAARHGSCLLNCHGVEHNPKSY